MGFAGYPDAIQTSRLPVLEEKPSIVRIAVGGVDKFLGRRQDSRLFSAEGRVEVAEEAGGSIQIISLLAQQIRI
jgi:hypothetical protein